MLFAVVSFLLSCYVLNYSYDILLDHLDAHTPNFEKLDENRKYYVIKNLMKAVYLCVLCVIGFPYFCMSFWGHFPNAPLKLLASLYCSNDCVGLYRVKKLPTSTRLHHVVTSVFLLCTYAADFPTQRVAQMLFYYTYFSACTFVVNAYLGLRLCFDEDQVEDVKRLAKHVYLLSCVLNWLLQFYYLGSTYYDLAYTVLLVFIVYDDVYLLRWLWREEQTV